MMTATIPITQPFDSQGQAVWKVLVVTHNDNASKKIEASLPKELFECYFDVSLVSLPFKNHCPDLILVEDVDNLLVRTCDTRLQNNLHAAVCGFSSKAEIKKVVTSTRRGVSDYFILPFDETFLTRVLVACTRGKEEYSLWSKDHKIRIGIDKLSKRERAVAQRIAAGLTCKAIAQDLDLSTRTVETHTRHIYQTLGGIRRYDLLAMRHCFD